MSPCALHLPKHALAPAPLPSRFALLPPRRTLRPARLHRRRALGRRRRPGLALVYGCMHVLPAATFCCLHGPLPCSRKAPRPPVRFLSAALAHRRLRPPRSLLGESHAAAAGERQPACGHVCQAAWLPAQRAAVTRGAPFTRCCLTSFASPPFPVSSPRPPSPRPPPPRLGPASAPCCMPMLLRAQASLDGTAVLSR